MVVRVFALLSCVVVVVAAVGGFDPCADQTQNYQNCLQKNYKDGSCNGVRYCWPCDKIMREMYLSNQNFNYKRHISDTYPVNCTCYYNDLPMEKTVCDQWCVDWGVCSTQQMYDGKVDCSRVKDAYFRCMSSNGFNVPFIAGQKAQIVIKEAIQRFQNP